jgi:hypothetical protein
LKRCCCNKKNINGSLEVMETSVTDSRCKDKCQYQCSVNQCEVFICQKHIEQVHKMVDRNVIFYVGTSIEECGYESFDGSVDKTKEGSATSFDEISVQTNSTEDTLNEKEGSVEEEMDNKEENEEEEGITTMIDREMMDDEDDEELIDEEINVGAGFLMTYGMEDQTDVVTDMEGMEETEDSRDEADGFPCTNAGLACLHQEWTDETKKTRIINSYVLMNTMGNCLVRRNRNLHFTEKARTWLERMVVSGRSGSSIPLLYHEGTLHANIFWNETDTGEIVGSLVSGLLTDGYNTKRFGYGSLIDHVRTRFTDPSLLTSTDYRYQFNTYAALLNIGARGNNTATILRRGFADEQGNEEIRMRGDEDDIFDACSTDSRKTLNQLASVLCTKPYHYFYTFTPNEKECVALAPIDEWINSEEAMLIICARELMSDEDEKKYKQALRDSAASVKLRSWIEFSQMFLQHLQFSSESPLGCVDYLFARMEFQNDALKGILPHWHILLCLTETFDHKNLPEAILDKIRGSVCDMFRTEDVGMWIAKGWISDISQVSALCQSVFAKCQHHCTTRCQIPLSG